MAFTVSHMLLAPVIYRLSQRRLPLAAVAIGCMTPDLFRLFTQQNLIISHLWRGLIFPDLWIGLVGSGLWYLLYRPVIFTGLGLIAPLSLHNVKQQSVFCMTTVCAVLLGTISHFLWDSFTHVDTRTWFARDFLQQSISMFGYHMPMHRFLQISTSLFALPWLWIWTKRYIANHHQVSHCLPIPQRQFLQRVYGCSFCCGMGMLSFYLSCHPELWGQGYELSGRAFKAFVQGWLICFSLGCVWFLWKYSQALSIEKSLPPR